ncbi:MAG: hypothetical protein WCG10_05505 [Chlamydiota bacterium]
MEIQPSMNEYYRDYSAMQDFQYSILESVSQDADSLVVATRYGHDLAKKELKHKKAGDSPVQHPFGNEFAINAQEIHVVRSIIEYMDSKSTLALGLPANQKHLKDEGKKIDHVHPLCFIWAIISQEDLRGKLRYFRDNSAFALKWNGFLGYSSFHDKGFGRNMEKYYNHRDPQEYLREFELFYVALGLRPEAVNSYAISKNWRDFASALVDESSYY